MIFLSIRVTRRMTFLVTTLEGIFPGRRLGSLSPEECRELVSRLAVYEETVSEIARIPEVLTKVLRWVDCVNREKLRVVCRVWRDVAVGCRRLQEFWSKMNKDGMHHIAIQLQYEPYLKFARTQEEFDQLWADYGVYEFSEIPPRFVRPRHAKRAFRKIRQFRWRSASVEWALQLEWESLQVIKLKGLYRHVDNVAGQFPKGPIDPRKIIWLRDNGVNLYKLTLRMIELKVECRELLMYQALYGTDNLESRLSAPLPAPTTEEYLVVYEDLMGKGFEW